MTEGEGPWIVAGMHRSGTSLIALALVSAGMEMGKRLLSGDVRNPPGYFEDLDFLDLDRRMLAVASPSDDGGHPDWGWTEGERLDLGLLGDYRDEARSLVEARTARGACPGVSRTRGRRCCSTSGSPSHLTQVHPPLPTAVAGG